MSDEIKYIAKAIQEGKSWIIYQHKDGSSRFYQNLPKGQGQGTMYQKHCYAILLAQRVVNPI